MSLPKFEKKLAAEWSCKRHDIADGHILQTTSLEAAVPATVKDVLKRLKTTPVGLIELLRDGALPRPGILSDGRPAWRKDEVEALVPMRERWSR